ncbi:universal stress protein [Nocardioides currus]|uniref:Universal stress protein n=1 Tax=Nocardioides currus TaxID=2133958 RepID=A0A2R7YSH4_9ACTN|nr:universal stress protein [Nocardioides currus]PUA79332.1 universal stress protein [Nocardioides currus]
MTPSPILLAYDGSTAAELALEWSAEEARHTGTPLVVMMVEDVQPGPTMSSPHHGVSQVVPSPVPGVLDGARARLARAGVLDVALEHRVGRVVTELLDAATTSSLLVVGSNGHEVVGEVFLGSVSQQVARHASCPVVVVRRPHAATARRIVVGVDGSAGSRAALEFACHRAELTGEDVVALHGWHVRNPSTDVWSAVPRTLEDEERRELLLAESIAGLREDHPDAQIEPEAVPVDPATCLVDASTVASMVVVGARGQSFVGGLLLGSVSQAVLRHAQCTVAVVREP